MREAADLTQDQMVEQSGWSISKVYRLESGRFLRLNPADVLRWMDLCGVASEQTREVIKEIARTPGRRGWWADYPDAFPTDYPGLEHDAIKIREYHPTLIPGLLQTEGYAFAMLRVALPGEPKKRIEQRVAARMARKAVLEKENPPELWVTIDEAALLREIGSVQVRREQSKVLHEMARRPGITVQVCRFSDGAHPAVDGPFTLLEFPDQEDFDIAVLESLAGTLYVDDREAASRFRAAYDHLAAGSASPTESRRLIEHAREKLGDDGTEGDLA